MSRTLMKRFLLRYQSCPLHRQPFAAIEWGPSPLPSGFVGADYTHDDGGALIIMCDTTKKLISYLLVDPRARWKKARK